MLDDRGDHDVLAPESKAVGQVIERFGGVAADDRHIVPGGPAAGAGEAERRGACVLVSRRGQLGLVAGPAVDAGVPGHERFNGGEYRAERACRCGRVERQVRALCAVHAWHRHSVTHQRHRRGGGP